jgi:hypothetical protein
MIKKFPVTCPCCNSMLKAQSMHCNSCDTTISGSYELPLLLKLEQKEQDFILDFVRSSGSLKDMAQKMKLSYPTVRNMLDELIQNIENLQNNPNDK